MNVYHAVGYTQLKFLPASLLRLAWRKKPQQLLHHNNKKYFKQTRANSNCYNMHVFMRIFHGMLLATRTHTHTPAHTHTLSTLPDPPQFAAKNCDTKRQTKARHLPFATARNMNSIAAARN